MYALTFDYGQWHSKEIISASRLVQYLLTVKEHRILKIPNVGGSSLVGEGDIPEGDGEGIPNTWVPQRNAIFLAFAFAWAEVTSCDKVYIGANCIDYSGYPDCRPEFMHWMENALNFASKKYIEGGPGIEIIAPIILKTKVEIIKLGKELGVPFETTWSCYKGGKKACGRCSSCMIRLKAFEAAGLEDPIEYE